jgi:hypothetical protein
MPTSFSKPPQYFESSILVQIKAEIDYCRRQEDMSKLQKAWFYNEYGSIDVLQFGEVPVPTPGPGQLLVKIRAAALNPVDFKRRDGLFRNKDSDFPV